MIDQEKVKRLYTKKVEKLSKLKAYFEKDSPIVSDSEFDELKKELLALVKQHPFLKKIKNLDNLVGYKPSVKFEKVKHARPMLSLGNAFDREDMIDFQKKIQYINFLKFLIMKNS